MSGIHKDGMGWNACGVWCGECSKDTCEGCEYEFKTFKGFSQETIDCLKKEIDEDNPNRNYCKYFECKHEHYEVCEFTQERCDWVGLCCCLNSLCEACENTDTCEIKEN